VVVLGESLCERLPGQRALCAALLHGAVHGSADLAEGSCLAAACLTSEQRDELAAWLAATAAAGGKAGGSYEGERAAALRRLHSLGSQAAAAHAARWRGLEQAAGGGSGSHSAPGSPVGRRSSGSGGGGRASDGSGAGGSPRAGHSGGRQQPRPRSLLDSGGGGSGRGGGSRGGGGGGGGGKGVLCQEIERHLGDPVQREWVLRCARAAAGGAAGAATVRPPPSRLYLQEAAGEMRLAFVLVSQPGL
jgi:hypothetical protein